MMFADCVSRLNHLIHARRDRKFYSLSYEERVAQVKGLFGHARMKPKFDWYFATGVSPEGYSSPYFDVIATYAKELNVRKALQIGCFTCQDSLFLAHSGFKGELVATDFDTQRLEYLRLKFQDHPIGQRIALECLDVEAASPADFDDVDMVFALAVLSNIQPEGLERLLGALASSTVKICVFGDIYRPQSLSRVASAPSIPAGSRSWLHPFLSLAQRSGMDAIFVPGFSTNDFRGIFVIHKGVPSALHERAVGRGFASYVRRQGRIKLDE
jgi:hypothetical protein